MLGNIWVTPNLQIAPQLVEKKMAFVALEDATRQELLTTYAALILYDDKAEITEENLTKLVEAAGGEVQPFWFKLFADLLQGKDIGELLLSGGGGGAVPVAAGAGAAAAGGAGSSAAAAAAEPEEPEDDDEEDGDDDMGFSLFE